MMNGSKQSFGHSHRFDIIQLVLGNPWESRLNCFIAGLLALVLCPMSPSSGLFFFVFFFGRKSSMKNASDFMVTYFPPSLASPYLDHYCNPLAGPMTCSEMMLMIPKRVLCVKGIRRIKKLLPSQSLSTGLKGTCVHAPLRSLGFHS